MNLSGWSEKEIKTWLDSGCKKAPARLKKAAGKKPAKKPTRRKSPAKKPVARSRAPSAEEIKKCAGSRQSASKIGSRSCTSRSPGGIHDPKVDPILIESALADAAKGVLKLRRNVTLEKKKVKVQGKLRNKTFVRVSKSRSYGFPKDGDYLTVAYGGGVDSTAMLVGLDQLWRETRDPKWIPVAVTFSDTGGEHPHTYTSIKRMDAWLIKAFKGGPHHPGKVVKVCYSTLHRGGGWGTGYTLEQQSLVNHSLPSISLGGHTCSSKYKIDAQKQWFEAAIAAGDVPLQRKGKRIVRAIGYDATEADRLEGHSTYVSDDEESQGENQRAMYRGWYPLIEWGWDRARCLAESKLALGKAPAKSSCFFCGAMRPEEIVLLARNYPDLLERAIFLEQVAKFGRHKPHGGLNRGWQWLDFVLGNTNKLPPIARVYILGGVVRRGKNSRALPDTFGKPKPRGLAENETYIEPAGQLMDRRTVERLTKQAKAYVKAAPDKGEKIWGWKKLAKNEGVKGRKSKTVKGDTYVWTKVVDKSKKGLLDKDMAFHPLTRQIPAFCDVFGFRKTPGQLAWNTLLDKHGPEAKHEISVEKIAVADERARRGCKPRRNNPRRLPMARTYESPFLTGF